MRPICTLIRFAIVVLGTCAVFGCASYSGSSLKPGQSTRADTRALMGEPAAVHVAPPGAAYAESWEYPRGPNGRHTYMARFNSQGVLTAIDQVLTLRTVAQTRIGKDTQDDVRKLLGRPATIHERRGGGDAWDYAAYADDGGMRKIRLFVDFDEQGRVAAAGEAFDPEEFSTGEEN